MTRSSWRRSSSNSTPDELDLLIRRLDDQPWPAIAEAVGGTAEGLRKKLARALERVRDHPELHDLFDGLNGRGGSDLDPKGRRSHER